MRADRREFLIETGNYQLTKREEEIAALVTEGLRNKEIAYRLGLATATVKAHLQSVYMKLHVDNRVRLTLLRSSSQSLADHGHEA